MLRVKDLKKGEHYAFVHEGNRCVCYVSTIAPGVVLCNYVVGLWSTTEELTYHDVDNVSSSVNLKSYDIAGFEMASGADKKRYQEVVNNYREKKLMSIKDKEEGVDDDGVYRPETKLGVKVVGSIDLSGMPKRSVSSPAEEEEKDTTVKEMFKNLDVKNYYIYEDEEIVAFKRGDRTGIAIGMVDKVFQKVGFYAAMNLYGKHNQLVKMGDVVDGNVVEGWPSDCIIMKADKLTKDTGGVFLKTMFQEYIYEYHWNQDDELKRREAEEEKKREELRKAEEEKREALRRLEEEKIRLGKMKMAEEDDTDISDADAKELPIYDDMVHRKYMLSMESLVGASWPKIKPHQEDSAVFLSLHYMASQFSNILKTPESNTYLMTREYLRTMMKRTEDYRAEFEDIYGVLGNDNVAGAIVWTNRVGKRCILIYNVDTRKNHCIRLSYIADDFLIVSGKVDFACSTRKEKRSLVTLYDEYVLAKNTKEHLDYLLNLVFCHLCMEADVKRTLWKISGGTMSERDKYQLRNSVEGYDDVLVRDASWYTNIFVNKTIDVSAYKAHRWCGSGADKHLELVDVSGYTKNGYTVKAKVLK